MSTTKGQPTISVGIVTGVGRIQIELDGSYRVNGGGVLGPATFQAIATERGVTLMTADGINVSTAVVVELVPVESATFVVAAVRIGIGFHWERNQDQRFNGRVKLILGKNGSLSLINVVGIEDYLTSVISSEMSATSHPELLKAHAITSRSWLLAQVKPWRIDRDAGKWQEQCQQKGELIRWYDRENHDDFDVCADDHCQRYQGVTRATTDSVRRAIEDTWAQVLTFEGEVCDARFSKSCGGMSEEYRAAWQDIEVPYLSARVCSATWPDGFRSPLTTEENARAWISGCPSSYCGTTDDALLRRVLPDFDQETFDFFRWQKRIGQEEVQSLLELKVGVDLGAVLSFEALERGRSGRIIRLRITGERGTLVVGKELEIRRSLSPSHLYSSAFLVAEGPLNGGAPAWFDLKGAGWGHGVGLCQIGAAAMAEQGIEATQMLLHYFLNAEIKELYSR